MMLAGKALFGKYASEVAELSAVDMRKLIGKRTCLPYLAVLSSKQYNVSGGMATFVFHFERIPSHSLYLKRTLGMAGQGASTDTVCELTASMKVSVCPLSSKGHGNTQRRVKHAERRGVSQRGSCVQVHGTRGSHGMVDSDRIWDCGLCRLHEMQVPRTC